MQFLLGSFRMRWQRTRKKWIIRLIQEHWEKSQCLLNIQVLYRNTENVMKRCNVDTVCEIRPCFKFEHISLHTDVHCLHGHISLHTSVHCTCISALSCHCWVFLWNKEKIKLAYIYKRLVCFLWYQYYMYIVSIPLNLRLSQLMYLHGYDE